MSLEKIGHVTNKKGTKLDVWYNASTGEAKVQEGYGTVSLGHVGSVAEAMRKAEGHAYNH